MDGLKYKLKFLTMFARRFWN